MSDDPRCAKCGHPRSNHPYRHPFVGPSKDDTIKTQADRIEKLEAKMKWADEISNIQAARLEELTAALATAVRLIDLAVELARWDLNPTMRDELTDFTTELKGKADESWPKRTSPMTDSTDNAPERIWVCTTDIEPRTAGQAHISSKPDGDATEYTRADLAPNPLGAVKVKPLVWTFWSIGDNAGADAPSIVGLYKIRSRPKEGSHQLFLGNELLTEKDYTELKPFAQSDYEVRIRSALVPADPLSDPRVKALVEAVTLTISCGVIRRDESDREFQTPMRCYEALAAALAAFEGSKDDD